jgi:DNA-binding response OmpR family regulator
MDDNNMKILVADDEPSLRELLVTNLEIEGFTTIQASNGQEALDAITREHPDVVLLDVMMPVMDGWSVLKELSKRPEQEVRVILITAKASDEAQLHGWELGADGYITKPFDLDGLFDRIREVAGLSDAEATRARLDAIADLQGIRE